MEIILRERIEKLGDIGDIVKVKDGYARNYLIPKGLAYKATESNKKVIIAEKAKKLKLREERIKKLKEGLDAYKDLVITIPVKVDENEHLYGSVTSRVIFKKLKELGYNLESNIIQLDEPIRELGEFDVVLKFMPEVQTTIKVRVVKEGEEEKAVTESNKEEN